MSSQEISIVQIENQVIKVLNEVLPEKGGIELARETALVVQYGLDSLDVVEIWMEMEAEFNISISDEEIFEETKKNNDVLTPSVLTNVFYLNLINKKERKT